MSDGYISLGECYCGTDATWYRTSPAPPPSERKRTTVGNIGIDDVDDNLCDGCYKGFTGSLDADTPGWKRVDSLQRQRRAGEDGQENRPPWDDGFGDSQEFAHSEAVPAQLVVPVMQEYRLLLPHGARSPFEPDDDAEDRLPPFDW